MGSCNLFWTPSFPAPDCHSPLGSPLSGLSSACTPTPAVLGSKATQSVLHVKSELESHHRPPTSPVFSLLFGTCTLTWPWRHLSCISCFLLALPSHPDPGFL